MATNRYWPKLWADNAELLKLAKQPDYLVNIHDDGTLACKACGAYVPWEPRMMHFDKHMRELDTYLATQRAETREEGVEGYYPKPCEKCGKPIPRTGKPGRPPLRCDACAFPNAQAILAELGL